METPARDKASSSPQSGMPMDAMGMDDRIYPSGRRTISPRTLLKRAVDAGVVMCITLFCMSLWNKATAPKESASAPAIASPFTLLIEQEDKFLVLPKDLGFEQAPPARLCQSPSGQVTCFKLVAAPPSK